MHLQMPATRRNIGMLAKAILQKHPTKSFCEWGKKQMILWKTLHPTFEKVQMGWLRFCTGAQSKLVPNGWKLRAILLRWLLPTSCTILFIFHEDTTYHQKEEPNQGFGQFLLFIYYSAQKSEQ